LVGPNSQAGRGIAVFGGERLVLRCCLNQSRGFFEAKKKESQEGFSFSHLKFPKFQ
jgi:hypothetical protein